MRVFCLKVKIVNPPSDLVCGVYKIPRTLSYTARTVTDELFVVDEVLQDATGIWYPFWLERRYYQALKGKPNFNNAALLSLRSKCSNTVRYTQP